MRSIRVRDRRYWVAGDAPGRDGGGGGRPVVHLLPGFDEYVVAYSESRVLADPHGQGRGCPGAGCSRRPSTVDGRFVGGGGGGCCVRAAPRPSRSP